MATEIYFPEAVYREQEVPQYRDNKWIEALPPILDKDGAVDKMQSLLRVENEHRTAPAHVRLHMVEGIVESFLQPLNAHVNLASSVSVLLRGGYVKRDPRRPEFLRTLFEGVGRIGAPILTIPQQNLGPGSGFAQIGRSGVGKSTAIEAVLKYYPQVLWHPRMHGAVRAVLQLVWLKISCPHDGTIAGLCIQFLREVDALLGTDYSEVYASRRATVDRMQSGMARVAFIHGLGLLVVDEIQNLNEAKSGGDRLMMNFFKVLRDAMKVPVLAVGTNAALPFLGGGFQVARRHAGMPPMEPMRLDDEFELFCESLFAGQYLRSPVAITPSLLALLHDLSQGIADLVVQLFVQAQSRALMCGVERLSDELFREVYQDSFGLLHPFLDAMRRGWEVADGYWDLAMLKMREEAAAAAAQPQPAQRQNFRLPAPGVPAIPTSKVQPATTGAVSDKVTGVPKRTRARSGRKGEESRCELVRVVERAKREEVSPHEALVAAGFIRNLSAEVLAG